MTVPLSKQKRVYHEVADQIEEAIVSGLLKPGEKLPAGEKIVVRRWDVLKYLNIAKQC
jgi:DNA-binding transcriptional regulator YhcF (GntR family)